MDVQEAVRDTEWQRFRRGLKGLDTASKLNNLKDYFNDQTHSYSAHLPAATMPGDEEPSGQCNVCVRVDNYLKALARGGFLYPGVSLEQALTWDWNFRVKK